MSRQYMQSGIVELERLFEGSRDDHSVLNAVLDELKHRSTDRAGRLRNRIELALSEHATAAREIVDPSAHAGPAAAPHNEERPNEAPMELALAPPRAERKPPKPHPPVRDQAADVLSAWMALEALSPATYRKPEDLVRGDLKLVAKFGAGAPLPWSGDGERSRPNKRLFYHVVLGAIRMPEATGDLLAAFIDRHQDRRPTSGFAAISTVTVDKTGVPVDEEPCRVSSFAWGLPIALNQDLVSLGGWPEAETKLHEKLTARVRRTDREGKSLPLDWKTIVSAHSWLVSELNLASHLVETPSFALRAYHYMYAKEPPESPILGSFFLKDLAVARQLVQTGKAPANLQHFLGMVQPPKRRDVLREKEHIIEAGIAPSKTPAGRWPSKGRHPLVTLQQFAVNTAARGEMGLVAVNGPPGTGKTTLLRDLVADLVVRRAKAMCDFNDPELAFSPGAEIRISNAKVRLSRLDAKLRGFEMVVASSNNAAVENVSKALPTLDAVAADEPGLRYFKDVSDWVAENEETWGLIAAVLGNAGNRYRFRERAWVDKDHGLQTYLAEAAGVPQWIEGTVENPAPRRKPVVIEQERPPGSHDEALRRWRQARDDFRGALTDVEARLAELEAGRDDLVKVDKLVAAATAAVMTSLETEATRDRSSAQRDRHREIALQAETARREAAEVVVRVEGARPGFFAQLFRTIAARKWNVSRDAAIEGLRGRERERSKSATLVESSERQLKSDETAARTALAARTITEATRDAALRRLADLRRRCGTRVVDTTFFESGHETWNRASPWLTDADHRARDRVFETAIALHRAFVDASARHLRHNLDVLLRTFFSSLGSSPKVRPLLQDLWSSLFLVVPVVSTTFASVEKMLSGLPPEALGWLLVDEAGQAVPQAMVGAMIRTKRAVVVGDPLQVPPVTTLPTELAEAICLQFGISPERWNAPEASVQTVADAASPLAAEFEQDTGTVSVGLPLLVHRRCMDPMFSISNRVAYSGLMVQATERRVSAIREAVGPSRWIDVRPGRVEDKWSEDEGAAVLDLIRRMAEAGVPELDIYVITPFRIVEQRMRDRIRASGLLARWSLDTWEWTETRVGTVHKVQGREADSVIFVLGAPLPAQQGARSWAGATPNILNVAVTRAKENLYVVGSRSAWRSAKIFSSLEAAMRVPQYEVTGT